MSSGLVNTSTSDTPTSVLASNVHPARSTKSGESYLAAASLHNGSLPEGSLMIDMHDARLRRMRRSVLTSASLHQDSLPSGFRAAMVTLTYRQDAEWSPRHLSGFVKLARQWLGRRGHRFRYTWVAELTKAGTVHYHIVFWISRRVRLPKPDKAGWWPHGMSRIEFARRPVGYLAKYASKGACGFKLPKGARMFGAGGFLTAGRLYRAWRMAPSYVRGVCRPADIPQRAVGGGWVLRASGEWFPSFWRVIGRPPGLIVVVPARPSWGAECIASWFYNLHNPVEVPYVRS